MPDVSTKRIVTPITGEAIRGLRVGDDVLLTGYIYTARDAAHRRLAEAIARGEDPPFPFEGNAVFYAGPTDTPPGRVIGAIGPTTSGRVDAYAPDLIARGLRFMIGKGERSPEVAEAIRRSGGAYFTAIGGVAAIIARRVKSVETVCYGDLGTEAIRRLFVEDFPVTVEILGI
ncbi:MAG: FumA C-terminus/TtdB family hydratase beta subunit [Clostridiales bacterium]|jgi:fumarate hydratase subunit beta|nr:FumA C-terminus/TtdB family hydratase beta subunit [Clostridiales bacterium]